MNSDEKVINDTRRLIHEFIRKTNTVDDDETDLKRIYELLMECVKNEWGDELRQLFAIARKVE